ncbi:hypothetical protein E8E11_002069 [Didymella keratinophila]|nr:hypothetical protein E8E11_002069 [Didymella keratinophila]
MSSSLPRTPISVAVSAAEKEAGRLTQRNLEIATRALVRDGPVVLGDMVDHAVLDRLNEKMVKDAYELHSRKESPHARSQLFRLPTDNLQGPLVTQVTPTTLGSYPSPCFISGNTALPPTPSSPPASQPTYTDADFDHPSIPSLVINTPLVTMTPGNGATETRLGMHSDTTIADQEGLHCERANMRVTYTSNWTCSGFIQVMCRLIPAWLPGIDEYGPEDREACHRPVFIRVFLGGSHDGELSLDQPISHIEGQKIWLAILQRYVQAEQGMQSSVHSYDGIGVMESPRKEGAFERIGYFSTWYTQDGFADFHEKFDRVETQVITIV